MNSFQTNSSDFDRSANIKFLPWVGNHYSDGFAGIKTLILGESHYQWDCKRNINNWREVTQQLVQEQTDGKYTKAFWTKTAMTFLGHIPSLADKKSFWDSVSFYNYVQESAGNGPRIAPANGSWNSSIDAFKEVLEFLKPNFILVLGVRSWRRLPDLERVPGENVEGAPRKTTWCYPNSAGSSLAYGINHPSSGFNARKWHPHVKAAMKKAELFATEQHAISFPIS